MRGWFRPQCRPVQSRWSGIHGGQTRNGGWKNKPGQAPTLGSRSSGIRAQRAKGVQSDIMKSAFGEISLAAVSRKAWRRERSEPGRGVRRQLRQLRQMVQAPGCHCLPSRPTALWQHPPLPQQELIKGHTGDCPHQSGPQVSSRPPALHPTPVSCKWSLSPSESL